MAPINEYDDMLVGGSGAAPGNEYDATLKDMRDAQKSQLQGSMFVASKAEPDRKAQALKLSEKTKIPVEIVERNFDTIAAKEAQITPDYDQLIDQNPKLSQWMSDANNAAVARDDIENLSKVEQSVRDYSMISTMYNSLKSGVARMNASVARVPALAVDATWLPINMGLKAIGRPDLQVSSPDWLINNPIAKYYDREAEAYKTPEMDRSIVDEISKGNYSRAGMTLAAQFVANAPQQAAIIASALSGFGTAALVGAGVTTAADANKEAKAAGVDPSVATINALTKGTIEAGFESLGTFGLLKTWENAIAKQYGKEVSKQVFKDFAKSMAYSAVGEANEEAMTSIAQDLTDYITDVNPNALEGIAGRAIDAGIIGGASGGLITAPSATAAGLARGARIRESTLARDFYLALGKSAEATKLRERLPQAKRQFVEQLVKDGPVENIYIAPEKLELLFQSSNRNPVKVMQDLGVLDSFAEAKETGGAVKIPLATWVEKVVGTDDYQALANDVKFDPNALSVNEAEAEREQAKADLEQVATDAQADATEGSTTSGPEFSGTIRVLHGSQAPLEKFTAPSLVEQNSRYDGGAGVFGGQTYFDETGHWVSKDGKYAQSGRGIDVKNAYGVELNFQKALVVSPKTLSEAAKLIGPDVLPAQVPEALKSKGYDGVIIRGMDDYLAQLEKEFEAKHPLKEGASQSEVLTHAQEKSDYIQKTTGLADPFGWQDQVVSFQPEANAKVVKDFGSRPSLSNASTFIDINASFDEEAAQVKQAVADQLKAAGFSPADADVQADVVADRARVRAGIRGQSPLEIYQAEGQQIVRMDEAPSEAQVLEQASRLIDSKAFKSWFDGSKVVREDNTPLAVYHGTADKFSEFKHKRSADGFYFTSNKELARDYARDSEYNALFSHQKARTIPVFLSLKNPLIVDGSDGSLDFGGNSHDELIEQAKAAGHDGVILRNTQDDITDSKRGRSDTYIAFEPEQIKSADPRKSKGTFDPTDPNIYHQSAPAPTFYSKLTQTIEQKMGGSQDVTALRAMLREIKPEEMKWSGLDEFLKDKPKVTKAEVLDFLRGNQLEIKEVTKGGDRSSEIEQRIQELDDRPDRERDAAWEEERSRLFEQLKASRNDDTKFSQYTLPGGENYREVLFTLPPKPTQSFDDYMLQKFGDKFLDMKDDQVKFYAEKFKNEQYLEANANAYRSSHWDEANVLAHVRLNDRVDAEGKRVLFVEEIQSDWHQAGRKQGYKGDEVTLQPGHTVRENTEAKIPKHRWEVLDPDGRIAGLGATQEAAITDSNDVGRGRVPDAPFKKTWHEFALKKILRMAAEQGYERVAWTTGEQQAERYDLSKKIGRVDLTKDFSGTTLWAYDLNGDRIMSTQINDDSEIASHVGKEVAEKLTGKKWGKPSADGVSKKSLKGLDLKVGGEGMKGFYDKIVPEFLNKFGKKFGAKVGETQMLLTDMPATEYAKYPKDHPYVQKNAPTVHALEITPELKNAALNEGFALFQGEGSVVRGFFDPKRNLIALLKDANFSTYLHEMGHSWLEEVGRDVAYLRGLDESKLNDVQKKFLADSDTILSWLGVESFEKIEREHHEKWAEHVEAYLMEGKAPSAKLRAAFARFKTWLTAIYKKLSGLNVELSPEIRGVMDRMIATEQEIEAAQHEMQMQPLFVDPKSMGMSDAQTYRYLNAIHDAHETAKELLNGKVMAKLVREQKAEYKAERAKVREEVAAEVAERPVYQAIAKLQKDGIQLDRNEIKESQGKDVWKSLPKGLTTKEPGKGISAELVAQALGFENGTDLIGAIVNAGPMEAAIEQATDLRMEQRYPDLLKSPELPQEAISALHNEKRSQLLRMELEHLASNHMPVLKDAIRRTVRRMPSEKAIREQAEKIIGGRNVRDLKPHVFQRAEIKAAKEAGQALAKGDIEGAFLAKRRELLNHELYRAALAAKENVEAALEKFKKISGPDDQIAKTRDMDLVAAARGILGLYGLAKSEAKLGELLRQIKAYSANGAETVAALMEATIDNAGPYQEIRYDKFLEMQNTVESIWDLAKSTRQIEIEGKLVDREEAKAALEAQLEEFVKPGVKAGYQKAVTFGEKAKAVLLSAKSSLVRVEHWAEAFDLGNPNGPARKYIWNPVSQAVTRYRLKKAEVLKRYAKVLTDWGKNAGREPIRSDELDYTFRDKTELMMAVLHSGNESNLSKLLRGREWGSVDAEGNLDRSRWDQFMARLWRDGTLTQADYEFAQKVWDLMDELKVDAQKAHKKLHGHYFSEITAQEIVTPWGTYRGGYVPAKVDPYTNEDASIRQEREAFESNNPSFQFPTTGRGFAKSRVNQYAAPLSLEMAMLGGHIDAVLRFSFIEPAVKQVASLVQDKGFRSKLAQLDPSIGKDLLTPWLQRTAQQKVVLPSESGIGKALDIGARYLRRAVAMQIMTANLSNALQQFTGLSVAMAKVKPRYLRNAMATYIRDIKGTTASIMEKSEWMRSVQGSSIYETYQAIDEILVNPTVFQKSTDFAAKHTYFMQTATQNLVNTVVWTGAYDQAIEQGLDERTAIQQADAAVRQTQGSNNPEDISRFETGTATARLFTQFAGYFNMLANLNASEIQKISREMGLKKGAGKLFYVYATALMVPAVVSSIIAMAMAGKSFDEDDDDEYLDDALNLFFGSQFRTLTASVPYVGQLANATLNRFNQNSFDDRVSLSPVVSTIEAMTGVPAEVYKSINGEMDNQKKVVKDVLMLIGVASSLPVGPIGKPVGYLMDVSEGKAEPSNPVDFTRGLVTGRAGN